MKIRISAGTYRSRNIIVPDDRPDLRPSKSVVREAALNMLQARVDLPECTAIDLFCGCGALGIEAISQGAAQVIFVDRDMQPTRQNVTHLDIPHTQYQLAQGDALNFVPPQKAQVVFADPPYGEDLAAKLLARKDILAEAGALWVLETERSLKIEAETLGFDVLKQKNFGKSTLWLLKQL